MAVAKVLEVIASSPEGIDQAVRAGVAKVAETVTGIEGVWIKDTKAVVKDGRIVEWRVGLAITFVVK